MKKYLNVQETNDFLVLAMAGESANDIIEKWSEKNLTPEEKKALKMGTTWLQKFQKLLINRMDKPTKDKLLKRSDSFQIKILDDYSTKQIMGEFANAMKIINMTREQLDDLAEQAIEFNCRGCKKDYKKCKLHEVFFDNFIIESGYDIKNCRYAYPEGETRLKRQDENKKKGKTRLKRQDSENKK